MFHRFIFGLVAALASGATALAAPLEAYGKLPTFEAAEISPSGGSIAFVVTDGEARTIVVERLSDKKATFVAKTGEAKIRRIQWAGDEHLIVTTSTAAQPSPMEVTGPRVERSMAFDLDLSKQKFHSLLENMRHVDMAMNTIARMPEVRYVDGKPAVFVGAHIFIGDTSQLGLFRVNLDSGVATLVEEGSLQTTDWLVSPDGRPVAQTLYDDKVGVWTLKLKGPDRSWRVVERQTAPTEVPDLVGLGRDGKSILIAADEKDSSGWRELAFESGAKGEVIPLVEDEAPIQDPSNGRLIGHVALIGDALRYSFFDPADDNAWRSVAKAFGADRVSLESWSNDRKKIVVRVDSAELGPAYALVDLNTNKADWLGDEYKDLKPADISPVKAFRYKAADGLEIPAYLTLPSGREPKALPLIVLAHGGPASRDTLGFDYWAQALASRGYAVLQANFRGSAGFGWDFTQAGFGEWGRKMQTDLSDGARELVREGIADPKRVCIVGASYGGYAALAGATIDHGVYRCAASYGGVSDLRDSVLDDVNKSGASAQRYWTRFMGAKDLRDPVLAKYSPTARAAEADIPILLVHGKDDTVVPLAQSKKMAEALQRAGKPVELVVLKGEDHWLSRGETRLAMLQAMVAFLEKNNPPN